MDPSPQLPRKESCTCEVVVHANDHMPPRQAEEDGDEGLPIVREKKAEATVTATAAAAEDPAAEVEDDEEESDEGDFEG